MTIINQEVKTISHISFTFKDFCEIVEEYRNSAISDLFPNAFKFEISEELREYFENLQFYGKNDTYNFIARHFGFDGWTNGGYYHKQREQYFMSVYHHGDSINY